MPPSSSRQPEDIQEEINFTHPNMEELLRDVTETIRVNQEALRRLELFNMRELASIEFITWTEETLMQHSHTGQRKGACKELLDKDNRLMAEYDNLKAMDRRGEISHHNFMASLENLRNSY